MLGYAGIFALVLLFLAMTAVSGFSRELTNYSSLQKS